MSAAVAKEIIEEMIDFAVVKSDKVKVSWSLFPFFHLKSFDQQSFPRVCFTSVPKRYFQWLKWLIFQIKNC